MRKVLVSFEVSVAQSSEHPLIVVNPDFVFSGEFDCDSNIVSNITELRCKVEMLARVLKDLGCQVSVLRKETSQLDID